MGLPDFTQHTYMEVIFAVSVNVSPWDVSQDGTAGARKKCRGFNANIGVCSSVGECDDDNYNLSPLGWKINMITCIYSDSKWTKHDKVFYNVTSGSTSQDTQST